MEKYYIYHIKDKKWGCTKHLEQRLAKQKYTLNDVCEIIEIYDLDKAAKLEKELNLKHGYFWSDTQEYKKALRNSKHGGIKAKEKNSKAVLQYDLQGNFIAEYGSILDACNSENGNNGVFQACKGLRTHANGFIWRYKETNNFPIKIDVSSIKTRPQPLNEKQIQFVKDNYAYSPNQFHRPIGKMSASEIAKVLNVGSNQVFRLIKKLSLH